MGETKIFHDEFLKFSLRPYDWTQKSLSDSEKTALNLENVRQTSVGKMI